MNRPTPPPRFQTLRELGSGSTGLVELAQLLDDYGDLPAGAQVAIKTLHRDAANDPRTAAAFRNEAELGSTLQHPSLARVLYHGERDGLPFLLMPFVPGRSLAERLEDGPLPEPIVRRLGAQIAGALACLHAAGVAHGDVKPENVRLDDEGRAVLVDLGFAQPAHDRDAPAARSGDSAPREAGSLLYLSPERAQGEAPGAAADVFALGVTLYEAAVARHPFATGFAASDSASAQLLAKLRECRYIPPSHRSPRISPFLDASLSDVLSPLPRARPAAQDLSRRFEQGESGNWWREHVHAEGNVEAHNVSAREHLTALVGRKREMKLFDDLFSQLQTDRRGAVCWLAGSEGMGKSRLVDEFAARARRRANAPIYLYVRCTEIAESQPSGVLLDLVRRWLALPRGAAPSESDLAEIERIVAPDEARALAQALTGSAADPAENVAEEAPDAGLAASAIGHWLVALATELPLLVFVDDVHRSSAVTRRILTMAVREMDGAQLLLVLGEQNDEGTHGIAGPFMRALEQYGERDRGPGWLALTLGPLTQEDVEELVERLFHGSTPRLRLASVLWLRSRGNPGLLAEILRGLLDSGEARPWDEHGDDPTARRLVLTIKPEALRLPGSLQRSIVERFRRLGYEERRWLGHLAVVGGRIRPDFLERAFPMAERGDIDAVLVRLEQMGWLTAAGERYRFARPALREAVYLAVEPERRAKAHASAAQALLAEDGHTTTEDAFQRAFHLRAAGSHEALLECLETLLASPILRAQPQRSFTLARWGLEALDALGDHTDDPRRLGLLEIAADTADRLGLRAEERQLLDQLAELFPDGEQDPAAAARVYLLHGRFAFATGQFGLARGMFRNAARFADSSADHGLISECARRMALVLAQVGELRDAAAEAQHAADNAQGDRQWVLAELAIGLVDLLDDRPEEAARAVDGAIRRLRHTTGEPPGVRALAHLLRARVWRSAGRPGRALSAAIRALRLARVAGERRLEAEAAARLGGLYLDADRSDEAEDLLREALLVADEIEDRRGQILGSVFLGILLWERDDPSARATMARAIENAREIGYQRAEAIALSILARRDRKQGSIDEALESTARAFSLVEERGAELLDRIVVVGTRALVLQTAGRAREAARIVGDLRKRMRKLERRLERLGLADDWRDYSSELLELVLSPDGNVYPRRREGS